jgi:hypothetical protein
LGDLLRIVVSICFFVLACILGVKLAIHPFSFWLLVCVFASLLAAFLFWPKRHRFQSDTLDIVEFVIEVPFQLMGLLFRFILHLFD